MSGALLYSAGLVAVGFAAAGPDQGVGLGVFVVEEVGVNRSVEARIVQLDREIIAALAGALRPGGSDLGATDVDPVARCVLVGFELRDHRGLDGDLKAEGDRRRTRLGRSAAEDGGGETFLPREEWAKPRGRKSRRSHCGSGDRGEAGLRPDLANERPGASVR